MRIISPDVGGGFGYKGLLCREEVALGWLALQVDHPVRWLEDCREHLTRQRELPRASLSRLPAMRRARGSCSRSTAWATSMPARIPTIRFRPHPKRRKSPICCRGRTISRPIVAAPPPSRPTNAPSFPIGASRAPAFVSRSKWSWMPLPAKPGLEPYEVRLRNMVRPDQMPFDNVLGKHFDSGDHPECLRRAVGAIRLSEVRARQKQPEPDGRLIGVGMSFFVEQGAHGTSVLAAWGRPIVPGYEQANVRLTADGDVEIRVGTHSHGQGHETTFAQVAHEILGVDFARIKVLQGDTLYTPYSTATWGSRSMVMGGGAVARASRMVASRAARNRRVAAAGRPGGCQSGRRSRNRWKR